MKFIEVRPHIVRYETDYLDNKVRVSFPFIGKSQQMIMYIGNNIARQYGYKKGDRVILLVKEDNPFIWQIKKDVTGFKLGMQTKYLKLQISWKGRAIPKDGQGTRFVNIEQIDGNMQISFRQTAEVESD
jgi:hypothetical protein